MHLGVVLPLSLPISEQVMFSQLAEALNLDGIWVSDNPDASNAYLVLSYIGEKTRELDLWTGISSPFFYAFDTFVSLSWVLRKRFGKRYNLGISTGDLERLKRMNIEVPHPATQLAEIIENFSKKWSYYNSQRNSPLSLPAIALGAYKPKMCEVAGKVADVLFLNSPHPADVLRAQISIHKNELFRKEHLTPCKLFISTVLDVYTSDEKPSTISTFYAKTIAKEAPSSFLRAYGYDETDIEEINKLSRKKTSKLSPLEEQLVSDLTISGSVNECLEKVLRLNQLGIDGIVFTTTRQSQIWSLLSQIRDEISQK